MPWSSFIVCDNNNIIAYNEHTHIYPQTLTTLSSLQIQKRCTPEIGKAVLPASLECQQYVEDTPIFNVTRFTSIITMRQDFIVDANVPRISSLKTYVIQDLGFKRVVIVCGMFRGLLLSTVYWCTRKPWSSSIVFYDDNIIAQHHQTNINPQSLNPKSLIN